MLPKSERGGMSTPEIVGYGGLKKEPRCAMALENKELQGGVPHEAARFYKGGDWHGGGVASFVTRRDLSIAADHADRAVRCRRAHRRAGAHSRRANANDARANRRDRKCHRRLRYDSGH